MKTGLEQVRVYLLGKFEVARETRVLKSQDWPRRKASALFQRLAFERRILKDQAIEFLWPERDLTSGANNLYRLLYSIRQTLDKHVGEGSSGEIFSYEDGIMMLKDSVWVDAREFERLCRILPEENLGQRFERFTEALSLYQGDFLPDESYEEWTALHRSNLIRLHREVSLALANRRLEQGDLSGASGLLTRLLSKDPADEKAHRQLMRLYALAGRRQEALRQYQICLEVLETELGVEPDAETSALYLQIQKGQYPAQQKLSASDLPDPGQKTYTQPLTPVSYAPALQVERPYFIGREKELQTLDILRFVINLAG
jgi:DNA-binding SARP family transcriptional activator